MWMSCLQLIDLKNHKYYLVIVHLIKALHLAVLFSSIFQAIQISESPIKEGINEKSLLFNGFV
jgi:hypothetical protein